jgi:hypothetical protein
MDGTDDADSVLPSSAAARAIINLSQIPQPSSKTPTRAKEGEDERGKERLTIARSDDQIDHSGRGCLPLLLLALLVLLVLFAPAR